MIKDYNDYLDLMKKAVIVVCSTPYSKRLKEKCFMNINGKMALEHLFDRIKNLKEIDKILAVPNVIHNNYYSDSFGSIVYDYDLILGKGDFVSPLHRIASVLNCHYTGNMPEYVIRITHDDIVIDPDSLLYLLEEVVKQNATYGCMPEIIEGAGVEVIKTETILQKAKEISFPVEHISYFVKGDKPIKVIPDMSVKRPYRLTLDYYEDYIVLETIFRKLDNNCKVSDICQFLDKNLNILEFNKLPEVTVYTCVKSCEKYIKECITSVLESCRMSKVKTEYILVDDSSQDNTLINALDKLSFYDKNNYKIILNESNKGLASSSNTALAQAKGKYIIRVDADDILMPHAINVMLDYIKSTDSVIVYPNYFAHENGSYQEVEGKDYHHAGCALMNKKVVNELKFTENLMHWDSLDLFCKIHNHPELKIGYYNAPIFYYRRHNDNLSSSDPVTRKAVLNNIIKKYIND